MTNRIDNIKKETKSTNGTRSKILKVKLVNPKAAKANAVKENPVKANVVKLEGRKPKALKLKAKVVIKPTKKLLKAKADVVKATIAEREAVKVAPMLKGGFAIMLETSGVGSLILGKRLFVNLSFYLCIEKCHWWI